MPILTALIANASGAIAYATAQGDYAKAKADEIYTQAAYAKAQGDYLAGVAIAKTQKPFLTVGCADMGHTLAMCDYLCDSDADEIEINADELT